MIKPLSKKELTEALKDLPTWRLEENELCCDWEFADFNEAFAFLIRTALLSEKMNHHANYSGVYNKVNLRLSTHDAGGITEKDVKMAKTISNFIE